MSEFFYEQKAYGPTGRDSEEEEFDLTSGMGLEEYLAWCEDGGIPRASVEARMEQEAEFGRTYRQAVDFNREQFPKGCELCGEPADAEMGEFYDPNDGKEDGSHKHVIAHAQCGIDAGMEIA